MTTWLVQITANGTRQGPADMNTASELTAELQRSSGRTGEPGVDPHAAFLGSGRIGIRQRFPHVSPQQAVTMAMENLRRWVRAEDVVSIEVVTHADWLEKERRRHGNA